MSQTLSHHESTLFQCSLCPLLPPQTHVYRCMSRKSFNGVIPPICWVTTKRPYHPFVFLALNDFIAHNWICSCITILLKQKLCYTIHDFVRGFWLYGNAIPKPNRIQLNPLTFFFFFLFFFSYEFVFLEPYPA